MKTLVFALMILSVSAFAEDRYGNLDKSDQKFYQNDSVTGKNQLERTDSLVRQTNVLMGEMQQMKQDIARLRAEVDELKSGKK